jgi:hypothetical protein
MEAIAKALYDMMSFISTEDPTAIHEQGIRKTYDMAQKGQTIQC